MADPQNPLWPELDYGAWKETRATLQLWTQIVGKIRLMQTPWLNHSWHVPLYVNSKGLTTSPIAHGSRSFDIQFDFIEHALDITVSDGGARRLHLRPQSVADFYGAVMAALAELGWPSPSTKTPARSPAPPPSARTGRMHSLRCRICRPLLAGAAANRPRAEEISHRLSRQVQPRAFLLGKLRSRGHPLLRPPRPALHRQRSRSGASK